MGYTAGFPLLFSALLHIITHFIAEYVNKRRILTFILKYLNENRALRVKNSHQRCFETTNFDRLHREELVFFPPAVRRTKEWTDYLRCVKTSNENLKLVNINPSNENVGSGFLTSLNSLPNEKSFNIRLF